MRRVIIIRVSVISKSAFRCRIKSPVNFFFVTNYKNNIATALMKLGKNKEALEMFNDLMKYQKPADELLYHWPIPIFENENYEKALYFLGGSGIWIWKNSFLSQKYLLE